MKSLFILFIIAGFGLFACHNDSLLGTGTQPYVNYHITILESTSSRPLGKVRVYFRNIIGDTLVQYTDSLFGRVVFKEVESRQNFISLKKEGYLSLDTLHKVTQKQDSNFLDIPLDISLKLYLTKILADTSKKDSTSK